MHTHIRAHRHLPIHIQRQSDHQSRNIASDSRSTSHTATPRPENPKAVAADHITTGSRSASHAATPATVGRKNGLLCHPSGNSKEGAAAAAPTAAHTLVTEVSHHSKEGTNTSCGQSCSVETVSGDRKLAAKDFMDGIKKTLGDQTDEYKRFKKAMRALPLSADDAARAAAFEELYAVLMTPRTPFALSQLLQYLSSSLQKKMRAHLASKGVEL